MAEHRGRDVGARGPERDHALEERARQRRAGEAVAYQTSAEDSASSDREETGTARRAEHAATGESHPNHLGEAEAAFERDRANFQR